MSLRTPIATSVNARFGHTSYTDTRHHSTRSAGRPFPFLDSADSVSSANRCHLLTIDRACPMARTAVISIRTDPKLKEALEQAAYWDNRTLAGIVEKIL